MDKVEIISKYDMVFYSREIFKLISGQHCLNISSHVTVEEEYHDDWYSSVSRVELHTV